MARTFKQPRVLMYHGIVAGGSDRPPGREPGAEIYDVPAERFAEQMTWIREQGLFVSTVTEKTNMEGRAAVILTFDDGEKNNFTRAWPVLKDFHYPAYFFVTVSRIGQAGYMDWSDLHELQDNGMMIGSHGMGHRILTELTDAQLEEDLRESKRVLEQNLDVAVTGFSVPRGFVNQRILDAVRTAGYSEVFVSEPGPATGGGIGRTAVKGAWSIRRFQDAVYGRSPLQEKMVSLFKKITVAFISPGGYDKLRGRVVGK